MNLTYRGIAYNTSSPTIETAETGETVTFLGRQSKIKQFNANQRQQPTSELLFMGRRYTR